MQNTMSVYKPLGKTPLEMVLAVKQKYPELAHTKIGYAGRLDPMAEGVLLLLLGDENKNKHAYEQLDKEYTATFIPGIQTDSFDRLGVVTKYSISPFTESLQQVYTSLTGEIIQEVPSFSAKIFNGKPLFYYAHNHPEEIPKITSKVTINSITELSRDTMPFKPILEEIIESISLVRGTFRQQQIIEKWQEVNKNINNEQITKITISIHCSAGTYIRSLINTIGLCTKTGAFLYSLRRDRVGSYLLSSSETI